MQNVIVTPQGLFLQFWEGALGPFRLGKVARKTPNWEICYSAQLCHFLSIKNKLKQTFKPPVAKAAVRSKVLVLLLLTFCSLLLPLWESVIVICFVVSCFVSVLVLQSS